MSLVAVVGGRGVIGAAAVRALRRAGRECVVVTSDANAARADPSLRHGDLRRPETLGPALEGVSVVVQSANFPNYPVEDPRRGYTYEAMDATGTCAAVEVAAAAGVRRYVFVSGVGAGAGSTKRYFRAVDRGEEAVLGSGMSAASLRPTLAYGPGDISFNRLLRIARAIRFVPIVDGEQVHQPVYLDDLGEVLERLAREDGAEGAFEFGGPERLTLRAMLERTLRAVGLPPRVIAFPERLVRAEAALAERLPRPPLSRGAIDFALEDFVADHGPLAAAIGPLPATPLEEGLSRYLDGARRA